MKTESLIWLLEFQLCIRSNWHRTSIIRYIYSKTGNGIKTFTMRIERIFILWVFYLTIHIRRDGFQFTRHIKIKYMWCNTVKDFQNVINSLICIQFTLQFPKWIRMNAMEEDDNSNNDNNQHRKKSFVESSHLQKLT